jgi:uncharacterized protein (UPF0332 family)
MHEFAKKHIAKAERFLAAADNDGEDGFYDTAISHGYYAMHHAARALLLLIDKSPKTHSGVINVLWNNRDKFQELKEADITKLTGALNKRVESDYVVDGELPSESDAEEIIENAKNFVSLAKSIVTRFEREY